MRKLFIPNILEPEHETILSILCGVVLAVLCVSFFI
jgi:hypothetical protein